MTLLARPLSARQQRILDYIWQFWFEHRYSPSIRDIVDGCEVSSTSVVAFNLRKLEDGGFIKLPSHDGWLNARAIVPLGATCPCCGKEI